jgi:pyrroline-5-carboxylate reductase
MSDHRYRLGFIGAGNMAEAIARGAIEGGVLSADQLSASDPSEVRREAFAALGVAAMAEAGEMLRRCEQVWLAVKPQVFPKLADAMRRIDADRQIVVSIMAGVTIGQIESALGGPGRVIRVMPNTPLMVGRGMSGIAVGDNAQHGDESLCVEVLRGCGEAVKVTESDLDAVTAVSGSGPAYVFLLAEAMRAAAQDLGLAGCDKLLVHQTIAGAAEMLRRVAQSDVDAADLRRQVTSPGGTTQAAIEHFQRQGFERLVGDAIRAARDRSVELGDA